jgi:hypothetical protein
LAEDLVGDFGSDGLATRSVFGFEAALGLVEEIVANSALELALGVVLMR